MNQPKDPKTIRQPEYQVADIKQYIWIILRHKWLILLALAVTLSGTYFYLMRTVPEYQSSVKILIEERSGLSVINNIDFFEQAKLTKQMATYSELLKSHQLLMKVVEKLKLNRPEDEKYNKIPEGQRARYLAEQLQKSITTRPLKDTNIIEVTVSHTDPELAANIANEIAAAFKEYNLQSLVSEAKSGYEFINEQSAIVSDRLKEYEEKLKSFKEKEKVVALSEEAKIVLAKLSEAEAKYNNTIMQRKENEVRLKSVKKELNVQSETVKSTTIAENPIVQQLKGQLYSLEIELAGLLKTYPETSPEVIQVKTKLSQAKEGLEKEVGRIVTAEVSSANPVHQTLIERLIQLEADSIAFSVIEEAQKKSLEQYKAELDRLPSKELQLARLERDKEVANQTYMMLMQRKEEMRLAQAVQTGNVSIADPALVPLYPYKPRKTITMMFAGMLGMALGIVFSLILESLDNTIRTPDDVTKYMNLPVLGVIPRLKKSRRIKGPVLAVKKGARESSAEAYRNLRTNIMAYAGNPIKTITITSAGPQEGKSMTSVNLAAALALKGKNVLLVDADLRRPGLHKVFNVDRHNGLSTVLSGESTLDDVIIKTEGFSFLTTGSLPSNPSEVIGSDKMKELISQVKERYDFVLFDSAPALGLSDSLELASATDGTILVIKTGKATHKILGILKSQLEEIGANILGVVLNDVNIKRDKYYSDYYYYYYYYSPYKDEEGEGVERRKRKSR